MTRRARGNAQRRTDDVALVPAPRPPASRQAGDGSVPERPSSPAGLLGLPVDQITAVAAELGVSPTSLVADTPETTREFVIWLGTLDAATLAEVSDLVAAFTRHESDFPC